MALNKMAYLPCRKHKKLERWFMVGVFKEGISYLVNES